MLICNGMKLTRGGFATIGATQSTFLFVSTLKKMGWGSNDLLIKTLTIVKDKTKHICLSQCVFSPDICPPSCFQNYVSLVLFQGSGVNGFCHCIYTINRVSDMQSSLPVFSTASRCAPTLSTRHFTINTLKCLMDGNGLIVTSHVLL